MPSAEKSHHRATISDYVLLGLLATFWGASYTFLKIGVETIPPVTLITARTLIAGVILVGVMALRGIALPRDWQTVKKFTFQAISNAILPFVLVAWASQTLDAGLGAILNSTSPIFAFLITWLITRHETVSVWKALGVGLGMAGVTLIIGIDAWSNLGKDIVAELVVEVATLIYGISAVYGRAFKGMDPIVPAAGSLIVGAILLLPLSIVVDRPWNLSPSSASVWALIYLSVLSTALGFTIFFHLLKTLGSVGATSQAYLRVPVAVLIGVLVLGEKLNWAAGIGMVLVLAGVAAMTMPTKKKTAAVIAQSTRLS